jgi:hypothetical protein
MLSVIIRLFKDYTHNILFVHFGGWLFQVPEKTTEKLNELGEENGVKVIAEYDGMEVDLQKLKQKIIRLSKKS